MKHLFFSILFIFTFVSGIEKYYQIQIISPKDDIISTLQAIGIEVDHIHYIKNEILELAVSDSDIKALEKSQIPFTVTIDDLTSHFQSRFTQTESRDFPDGSMGGYYNFEEVVNIIDGFHFDYPNIVGEKISIGTSLEGRHIWAFKVSDNPEVEEDEPEVLYTGLHHAREPMSMMNLIYYIMHLTENYGSDLEVNHIVNNRQLWFIPVVNPDGYVYNESIAPGGGGMHRKNKFPNGCSGYDVGVDLNRNYSYFWAFDDIGSDPNACGQTYRGVSPESESEIQSVTDFAEDHEFKLALNYHSYGNLFIHPFGYLPGEYPPEPDLSLFREYGDEMTKYNNYLMGTGIETVGYTVNGEANDWFYGDQGVIAYTPEIGTNSDNFWPSTSRIIPLAEENLYPNIFLALTAGSNYSISVSAGEGPFIQGDIYPFFIEVMNSGLSESNGDIILSIDSGEYCNFELEELELDGLDARTGINLGDIAYFQILPSTPNGTIENITVSIMDEDGYMYQKTLDIIVGETSILLEDNFENEMGWLVGASDDNANSGIWDRVIPNGTSINGQQIQPGEDHSEDGSLCFVTGNGIGPGPGYDDIDGGKTTLISPTFNLMDYEIALVSYWRWYTNNLGDSPDQDFWRVEVSHNGGINWVTLENTYVSNNSWEYHQFNLNEVLPILTNEVVFRFIGEDIPPGSLVEAALDDFKIEVILDTSIFGDINNDGSVDVLDIVRMVNIIVGNDPPPTPSELLASDLNNDGDINILDVVILVNTILES